MAEFLRTALTKQINNKNPSFITFVTCGYPSLSLTPKILLELEKGGATIIELGIPFSDPLADGPTIQHSSETALSNGVTLDKCFETVKTSREQNGLKCPVLLMGYYNNLLSYGIDKSIQKCKESNVNGFIIVDFPININNNSNIDFYEKCQSNNIAFIPLITPSSSDLRIEQTIILNPPFIYVVSKLGVTGSSNNNNNLNLMDIDKLILKIRLKMKHLNSYIPLALGFGISNNHHFKQASQLVEAIVVGSKIIDIIKNSYSENNNNKCLNEIALFCKEITKNSTENDLFLSKYKELYHINYYNKIQNKKIPTNLNRSGDFGEFGGQYVPESLIECLNELEKEFNLSLKDPKFNDEIKSFYSFVGRPSMLQKAKRLTQYCKSENGTNNATIWLKREDLNHTGSHKINNALGQVLLALRLNKKRIICETGAGQHGVATATVCAHFGLECIVYMGEEDVRRQALNVFRIKILGANVIPVKSGSKTLKDAVNEAMRDWVTNVNTTHYVVGSCIGPHPFPKIVREYQSVIGKETKTQLNKSINKLPDAIFCCVGGGSNAIGMFYPFIENKEVQLIGVEAAGKGTDTLHHSATLTMGTKGVFHGTKTYVLQNIETGQINETKSICAGLDYPGVGPEHSFLKDLNRAKYTAVKDEHALLAFKITSQLEGIIPALETCHAIYAAIEHAKVINKTHQKEYHIVVCLSGRGDKDVEIVKNVLPELGPKIGWDLRFEDI